ncbi:AAA domain-containing protein [Streptomyces goshikiensis]|uniref:caspase, EACC1-associated type n=1 Tax=Streptomyces goshikiensis TaxID=1942 RepID=UPI0036563F28
MSRNHALLIGTANYQDPAYTPLAAVRADVHYLSQVLEMPSVGRFEDCVRVEDSTKTAIMQSVESFLAEREADELVVLYLSGHGVYETEDGQLYYVAADTSADQVQSTAVKASFITEQLEACAARRKVLLLDCCFSGAAVQGFRSKGGGGGRAGGGSPPAVEASGVYVITASHHWEESFTSDPGEPSQFTQALVRGLHTGQGDLDGDGRVSADDLFRYVSRELKKAPADRRQTPTKSSLSVTGDIFLANSAVGRQIPALKPLPADAFSVDADGKGVATSQYVTPVTAVYDDKAFLESDWPKLLDYYLDCLRHEEAGDAFLQLPGSTPARAIWPGGQESLLSGAAAAVPAPAEIVELAEQAQEDGSELWYGYPTVVVFDGNKQKCAPLIMQQIELVRDAQGRSTVVAAGPAVPHAKLILERLGKDEGLELLAGYRPSWRPGFRDEMVRDLRALLDELALADTEHLDPGALGDGATLRARHEGARNLAVVFAARSSQATSAQLVKDYQKIRTSVGQIPGTALGALSCREETDPAAEAAVQIVAPLALNEGQEAVIRAAMSRKLTVATGPPGTGKSQLIVNAVATARAAGLTVLVASTNNKAVDEVWERAEQLAPGLLVRTGSRSGERDNVEDELAGLAHLTGVSRPPVSSQTRRGELRNALRELNTAREHLGEVAERERTLSDVARRRHVYTETRRCDPVALAAAFGEDSALDRWCSAAQRVATTSFFGAWRRRRVLRRLSGLPVQVATAEEFGALLAFARDEALWRRVRRLADAQPTDAELAAGMRAAERQTQSAAQDLMDTLVREEAGPARQLLHERIEAVRSSSPAQWATLDKLLPSVSGWAVTARSARRFRDRPGLFDLVIVDEASQCSTLDVLPLLFRAKRALVIGDPMQLPHITQIQPPQEASARESAGVRASWLEEHRLGHRAYSSFHAAAGASGGPLLLDEHFRCHPDIVGISNRYCYANRLTVLTDPRTLRRLDGVGALQWLDVQGAAQPGRNGSWINTAEAERVHIAVERLLGRLPAAATIGVVTPFRAQKELIAQRWAREPRVRVGTVHTFQGGQQDVMLLSLVAGPRMRASAVSWLKREVNLWNVAITRARSHLIVLGDEEFWSRGGGIAGALQDAAKGREAASSRSAAQEPWTQLVGDRFQKLLGDAFPDVLTDRDAVRDGYRCDFELRPGASPVPVQLDHGVGDDEDPARHLRLALTASGLVPGGIRVPEWEVWDGRLGRVAPVAQRPV